MRASLLAMATTTTFLGGGAPGDQPIANSVDRLKVQLVIGLDGNEAHVLALDRLGNGLGIDEVVLVGLHEGLHKLSWNQLHIMALCSQRSAEKVSTGTCLQADQGRLQVRRES